MATQAQLNANRANAQRSTGPKTDQGKTRASQNAFKTGLFAEAEITKNENPEELAQLTAEYYDHHQPATPEAREILDDIIMDAWRKRRLRRAEAQVWNEFSSPEAIHASTQQFARIERIVDSIDRRFSRNLDKLHALETQPEPEPEPAPQPTAESSTAQAAEPTTTNPENGFVSSTGEWFHSETEWRFTYYLRPGHPLDFHDCPTCRSNGGQVRFCTYEVKPAA
jgi:hypothetical protein